MDTTWEIKEKKSCGLYFEIHFYFDSVKNYDNNRSVDMYIGNHFRKRRVPVAGLQKRISFLSARRGATRETISRVCSSSFRFFGRNFDVRIFDAGTFSFIRSLNTCERFAARALPAATFSRDGKLFHLTRIESHSILSSAWPRTWPHVIAFRESIDFSR